MIAPLILGIGGVALLLLTPRTGSRNVVIVTPARVPSNTNPSRPTQPQQPQQPSTPNQPSDQGPDRIPHEEQQSLSLVGAGAFGGRGRTARMLSRR